MTPPSTPSSLWSVVIRDLDWLLTVIWPSTAVVVMHIQTSRRLCLLLPPPVRQMKIHWETHTTLETEIRIPFEHAVGDIWWCMLRKDCHVWHQSMIIKRRGEKQSTTLLLFCTAFFARCKHLIIAHSAVGKYIYVCKTQSWVKKWWLLLWRRSTIISNN